MNVQTFGFEREFFVLKPGTRAEPTPTVVVAAENDLPYDGCGYLAEARGREDTDPVIAAYLLKAEEDRITDIATARALSLDTASRRLDAKFKHECMRKYGKQPQTDFSMSRRWNARGLCHAGLHVHFGSMSKIHFEKDSRTIGPLLLNIPRIVMLLDREYAPQIREARRAPGLYRLRPHGFEYRSLPASLDPLTVAKFLRDHRSELS